MKRVLAVATAGLLVYTCSWADLLTNPGFEEPYTSGWSYWDEGNIEQSFDSGWAHSGTGMVGMWWWAGLWQNFDATPGDVYELTAYAYLPGDDPAGTGVYGVVALEWYNSSDTMIGTWTSQPIDTAHYSVDQWLEISSGNQTAPVGTAYGRALVRINNNGSGAGRVYYDDVDVGMIPEPTVLSLMAGGLLGALGLRRMRRK